jgi:hypothetical protein
LRLRKAIYAFATLGDMAAQLFTLSNLATLFLDCAAAGRIPPERSRTSICARGLWRWFASGQKVAQEQREMARTLLRFGGARV